MANVKAKQSELPRIKKKLIADQNGLCPICKKDVTRVTPINVVVDHDHKTGIIRAAMHRGCNAAEGKVKRLIQTWGKAGADIGSTIKTLENLISFWKKHKKPQSNLIHPTHKTAVEKRVASNKKRAKKAKQKREAIIARKPKKTIHK